MAQVAAKRIARCLANGKLRGMKGAKTLPYKLAVAVRELRAIKNVKNDWVVTDLFEAFKAFLIHNNVTIITIIFHFYDYNYILRSKI